MRRTEMNFIKKKRLPFQATFNFLLQFNLQC